MNVFLTTMRQLLPFAVVSVIAAMGIYALGVGAVSDASSHREAPRITGDPKADATDLYAFRSDDDMVTLIANYLPFQEPSGGPNFYSFDDTVRYEINVDNDGDTEADVIYRFEFDSSYQTDETFLYATGPVASLDDPNLNYRQTYTLTKITDGDEEVLGTDIPVPPSYVGLKTIPGDYDELQAEAYFDLPGGGSAFAGQSEDPFFVDLGGAFDLLNVRKLPGNDGGGIDALAGFNVLSLVLEVPMDEVTKDGKFPSGAQDPDAIIGVWTSSYRQATSVLNTDGTTDTSGPWVQVSRLGQPLVNEVVIPVGLKDRFNASSPSDDVQFANYVANPEFPKILNALFGIVVPPQDDFGTADQRDDLITIFLTGIAGLNQPADVVPSEQLRLNMMVPITEEPNALGVIAGDNQGFPNGRRLGDDVVDVALRVMAGAAYPLFHPEFTPDPVGVQLGDGVDHNDRAFRSSFPFVALPYNGFESVPHPQSIPEEDEDDDTGIPEEKLEQVIERLHALLEVATLPDRARSQIERVLENLENGLSRAERHNAANDDSMAMDDTDDEASESNMTDDQAAEEVEEEAEAEADDNSDDDQRSRSNRSERGEERSTNGRQNNN